MDEDDEPQAWDEAPLFAELDRKSKHIDMVSIRRTEPASGYLGTMPPDVSEASLFTRWGGGSYILEGKSSDSRIVPNARRQLKLAGDPVFKGEVEEMEWRRSNGLPPKVGLAVAPAPEAISTRDLMVMLEEKEERRRAEQLERERATRAEQLEREDRERRLRDERDAQVKKADDDRKAQAQKDADEREDRRARAQREDDERRARIHREDMERLQAQNAAQLAQSQQFFQQLATTMQANAKTPPSDHEGGAVKALLTGLQVARDFLGPKDSGDEPPAKPPDMLTSLIQRLPETLAEVRKTAGGIRRELTGGGAAAPAGVKPGEDFLTITGPTASKAKKVIQALMAAGKDPELELSRMLTMAAGALAPSTPRPAPSSSRPAPAPVDRTDAPSSPPSSLAGLPKKKGPPQRRHRRDRVTVAGGSARSKSPKVSPVAVRPVARAAARRRRKGAA